MHTARYQVQDVYFQEQVLLESVVKILTPFKRATVTLSGETFVTLSMVLPSLLAMERTLAASDDDALTISKMKDAMRANLEKRRERSWMR